VKPVVLSHGDLDGITSGAIAMLAFPGAEFYFTRPSQIHHDLFRIAKDRPEVVSISDIAINTSRFEAILRAIEKFPEDTTIHWTDHHPIPTRLKRRLQQRVEFFHERGPSAAEMVYRMFSERVPMHALHLALYGAIGDFCDDTPFAREHFEDFDKRTLYLESGILVQALQEIDYQRAAKDLVRSLALGMTPSSMSDIVNLAMKATRIEHEVLRYVNDHARKMGQVGYVLDMPIGGYRGKSAKFAAYATDSQIGISARSHDDEIDLSIRLRNSTLDLNKALKEIVSEIPDAHGGGHPQAAGAGMKTNDFPEFLQSLAEYVEDRG
jgi:RecJ-like exonuclease